MESSKLMDNEGTRDKVVRKTKLTSFALDVELVWRGGGLFIGDIKSSITLSELAITNHLIHCVHSLKGKIDYYYSQLPPECVNGQPPFLAFTRPAS
jgi:hypothetical protein